MFPNGNFLMKEFMNSLTTQLEKYCLDLTFGHCHMKITRSMFDGKMSKIPCGADGASCQFVKDLELIQSCFPINRQIHDAITIISDVDFEEFMKLDSNSRFGLTHPPSFDKVIVFASPLHSYLYVFWWLMLLIRHRGDNTSMPD